MADPENSATPDSVSAAEISHIPTDSATQLYPIVSVDVATAVPADAPTEE
jgi:hypothetical protein